MRSSPPLVFTTREHREAASSSGPLVCPEGNPKSTGPGKVGGEGPNRVARGQRAGGLVAAAHLAEHEPARLPQDTGQPKLRQHAIDTIRTLVDVLDEQNAAVWRRSNAYGVAERGRSWVNVPPKSSPSASPGFSTRQPVGLQIETSAAALQSGPGTMLASYRRRSLRQPTVDHRSMERRRVPHWQVSQVRSDVLSLYPTKIFGVCCGRHPSNCGSSCTLPYPPRAAMSADDRRVVPGPLELPRSDLGRARGEHRRLEDRFVVGRARSRDAGVRPVPSSKSSREDTRSPSTRPQCEHQRSERAGLDHERT